MEKRNMVVQRCTLNTMDFPWKKSKSLRNSTGLFRSTEVEMWILGNNFKHLYTTYHHTHQLHKGVESKHFVRQRNEKQSENFYPLCSLVDDDDDDRHDELSK